MDQVTLVTERVDEGRKLLKRLAQAGVEITTACWLKTHDDGEWYLYIATPLTDEDPIKAYRRVHLIIRDMPGPHWIDPFDVKLVSPTSPVAKTALEIRRRFPTKDVMHSVYRRPEESELGTEEAYVYPLGSDIPSH
jgi:hypothetical protein